MTNICFISQDLKMDIVSLDKDNDNVQISQAYSFIT